MITQKIGINHNTNRYDDNQSWHSGSELGSPISSAGSLTDLGKLGTMQTASSARATLLTTADAAGGKVGVSNVDGADCEEDKKANLFMTTFNVVNSIIGSGIISMPFALRSSGFGLGLVLLILVSVVTDYSLNLLIIGGFMVNANNYQDLVRSVFGRVGFIVITIMQATYPFIAMISYNVIIGDTLTKLARRIGDLSEDSILADRRLIVFLATLLFTFPLSLYRRIASLSKISVVSTLIIIFIICTMTIRGTKYTADFSQNDWLFINKRIPQSIAIMAFSFMCQHNSYLCYHSLKKRSLDRWSLVVHMAVSFSFVASGFLGVVGYATFTEHTQGDVLENYCFDDDLINVARLFFSITIMFTYPVECFVAREVIENTFFYKIKPVSRVLHFGLTAAIVTAAMLISMATNCVSIVVEFNGIVTAAPLAFILPPLCVLRLQNEPVLQIKNIPAVATLLLGATVIVSGLIVLIMDIADGIHCSHGDQLLRYCGSSNMAGGSFFDFLYGHKTHGNISSTLN